MVKGDNTLITRDPIRTRKQSAKQERKNSVSDIKEFFQARANTPKMTGRKDKEKERERKKELQETRENIKAMIASEDNLITTENNNANGGEIIHANPNQHEQQEHECIDLNPNLKVQLVDSATQTSDDEILSALKELASKYKKLEDTVEDPRLGLSAQLAKTQDTVSKLYTDINGAVSGLKVQMESVNKIAEKNTKNIETLQNGHKQMATLLDENKRLIQELKTMQGLVQKFSQQATTNSNQLLDLTQRGMEQNLVLHGVDNKIELEDARREPPHFNYKERCQRSALNFFKDVMNLDLEVADIWKAHRMGPKKQDKVRPLIVKVSYAAKDLIMENLSSLKDKSNPITKQRYFVSEQIPEGITEAKKQISSRLKTLRDLNDKKAKEDRSAIFVVNNKILIDDKLDTPEITTPQPSELFLDVAAQSTVDQLQAQLVETETQTLRNSQFIGLAAHADNLHTVQDLYKAVMQRYPASDHAMMAYSLKEKGVLKNGFCDDREYGAGSRLRKLIYEMKMKDTVVFVLRKYGGVHLGFNRFDIIEKVAKEALELL